jgi:hypothetical protein
MFFRNVDNRLYGVTSHETTILRNEIILSQRKTSMEHAFYFLATAYTVSSL